MYFLCYRGENEQWDRNVVTAVYWNIKSLLLLMVTDYKMVHFEIRNL